MLFRRSVLTAAIVYAVIDGLEVAKGRTAGEGLAFVLGIAAFVAGFAGPVFVQGALVEIVRNVHEGRVPKRIDTLYRDARAHFWSLLGASIMYGLGVFFGLILLIVPGLIAAARWCLFAPMIMLEGYTAEPAGSSSTRASNCATDSSSKKSGQVLPALLTMHIDASETVQLLCTAALCRRLVCDVRARRRAGCRPLLTASATACGVAADRDLRVPGGLTAS